MSNLEKEHKLISFSEYMSFEEESEEKHDYYFGEIYNMSGGQSVTISLQGIFLPL